MPTQVMFEGRIEGVLGTAPEPHEETLATAAPGGDLQIDLALHDDLAAIEKEWRAFEERADCTVFQTFDWLSAWQRNLGAPEGVKPVIVIGRHQGAIMFVMPFALDAGGRTLRWLGASLCNYNGPLLAPDFARRVGPARFLAVWREVRRLLHSRLGYDTIDLEKMPATIGAQPNPFCALRVTPHMNKAYLTNLGDNWDSYYEGKRSAATRRSDRKKQRRLAEHGEVTCPTATSREEIVRTLDALIEQKTASYARLGVDNMFEQSGYRDFFLDMATGAQSAQLTHMSRVDVGTEIAAANFGLVHRGAYIYLLASYNDGEVSRFGPGHLQLLEIMRYAIGQGLKVFDFTIGDEPYKREWNDFELDLYDHVAPATLRGMAVAAPMMAKRELKRRLRQSPRVWNAIRRARMAISALRRKQ